MLCTMTNILLSHLIGFHRHFNCAVKPRLPSPHFLPAVVGFSLVALTGVIRRVSGSGAVVVGRQGVKSVLWQGIPRYPSSMERCFCSSAACSEGWIPPSYIRHMHWIDECVVYYKIQVLFLCRLSA